MLRDLKERGLNCPRLVIGDGHLGIWGALANVYPDAAEQRCWNHKMVNVLDRLPRKAQPQAKGRLQGIAYAGKAGRRLKGSGMTSWPGAGRKAIRRRETR